MDPEEIREQLRRCRELHKLNPDAKAREALQEVIRELERQLGEAQGC